MGRDDEVVRVRALDRSFDRRGAGFEEISLIKHDGELRMEEVGAWVAEAERVLSDCRLPNRMRFPLDRGVVEVRPRRHGALISILGPRRPRFARFTALFLPRWLPSGSPVLASPALHYLALHCLTANLSSNPPSE